MTDGAVIEQAWPDWSVLELIGQGSYGTVYHVCRKDVPDVDAVVKIIAVPADEAELLSLKEEGFSDAEIRDYISRTAENWRSEILLMKKYQGMSHFVSIEDCKILDHPQSGMPGKLILIRMEKLKSLSTYVSDKTLSEVEVIQLGLQLCDALQVFHTDGVLHRDVKPGNIFVNDRSASGVLYKLGDFGVSRRMDAGNGTLSMKGALNYMAPEMIRGENYDHRADLYALGLTLYKLMNEDRMPFLPARQLFTYEDYAVARRMRITGVALPPAVNASPALNQVLARACAFDPDQRFASAADFASALQAVLRGEKPKETRTESHPPAAKKHRLAPWILRGILLAAIVALMLWLLLNPLKQPSTATIQPVETEIPMLVVVDNRGSGT